jgi:hypothetical protein
MRTVVLVALLTTLAPLACVHAPTVAELAGGRKFANLRKTTDFPDVEKKFLAAKKRGEVTSVEIDGERLIARFKAGKFESIEWWRGKHQKLSFAFAWLRDGETVDLTPKEFDYVFRVDGQPLRRMYSTEEYGVWCVMDGPRVRGLMINYFSEDEGSTHGLQLYYAVLRARDEPDPYAALVSYGFEGISPDDPRLGHFKNKAASASASGEQGTGRFASASAPAHRWTVEGPAGTTTGVALHAYPPNLKWVVSDRDGKVLAYHDKIGGMQLEIPPNGALIEVSPLGMSDGPIRYVIRTDHTPGVTLSTADGDIGDPVELYATTQPLGPGEKGTAAFKRRNDDSSRHPLFNAPMHQWTVPGPAQKSRKIQIDASANILVIGPGIQQPPPGTRVEFWLDYDAGGVASFHVLPATPDTALTYSVDASGVYEIRGYSGSSSGGSSTASTADTWATTQAALERRLAAIDRELVLAREGAARQIDVVGTRKTDHSEITYYQEKEGGAYQDHWAKKQRELEKEREAVLAELAAHAARKP